MNSKSLMKLLFSGVVILLLACSDADKEKNLVDLFTTANQDVTGIQFAAGTEDIVSINSNTVFTLEGIKSNSGELVTITNGATWSLSPGAASTIDQNGNFRAGAVAESVTISAQFGVLNTSRDIRVSTAKFDRVIGLGLDISSFSIDMCQSQVFSPVGQYIDEDNNNAIEERLVDSTIIDTIQWTILNQEDSSPSLRALIETVNEKASLHTLAAGGLIIQATAPSAFTGNNETSDNFELTVGNGLNSIKLCPGNATDLNSCSVTSISVEQDQVVSLIAVGNYGAAGSTTNQNITRKSKWGISDASRASTTFSSDLQRMDIRSLIDEETDATLSLACGNIEQTVSEIQNGVDLDSPVSCGSNSNCEFTSMFINIDQRSVSSLEVSANSVDLTDDVSTTLGVRPAEISLVVTANFTNGSPLVITSDTSLIYDILEGESIVIRDKANSPGVFTVLGVGTARIQIDFRNETFIALIQIP